jgi:NADH-quinone oxidoreductase subunit J
LAVLFGFALTYSLIYKSNFQATDRPFDWSVKKIGDQMLATGADGYALPFEVVSILLLAAMVGCIVIAIRIPGNETQNVERPGKTEIENIKEKELVE